MNTRIVSKGARHSAAVKRGIERASIMIAERELIEIDRRGEAAALRARVWRGMLALLGKAEIGRCIPDPDAIEAQLKAAFRSGYIKALRDVSRERQRMERARSYDALPRITMQEAAQVYHAYDRAA